MFRLLFAFFAVIVELLPELCQLIFYDFLLSQYIYPWLLYFYFEFFSYRGDLLIIQIILTHSSMVIIFICFMETVYSVSPIYFFLSLSLSCFVILFYNSCVVFFYLLTIIYFFHDMSSSWTNYLRRFLLVID